MTQAAPIDSTGWDYDDPVILDDMRRILTEYSHIPEKELIPHVKKIRLRAWNVFKYPTFGRYGFCRVTISTHPQYQAVLKRLQAGETMLDLGCGVGQDLRKPIFDGIAPENVAGAELEPRFIEYGYDLFNDRTRLNCRFYTGDFFKPETMGLNGKTFDIIYATYFFHLFNYDEQFTALVKAVRLLQPKPGSMLFGRQYGQEKPSSLPQRASRSGESFGHNPASWNELVQKVARETGIPLHVDAVFGDYIDWAPPKYREVGFRWVEWCITRVQRAAL